MSPVKCSQREVLKTAEKTDAVNHVHSTWLANFEIGRARKYGEWLEPVLDVVATTTTILLALM